MENETERCGWPNSWKGSVIFGMGMLAADNVLIKHDIKFWESPNWLNGVYYGVIAAMGTWRIVEPFLLDYSRTRHLAESNIEETPGTVPDQIIPAE